MANTARVRGFRPVEGYSTGTWTALVRQYPKTAGGTSTNIFIGDVVSLDTTAADGSVLASATGDTDMVGVVVAVGLETTFNGQTGYFDPDNLSKRHLLAADAGIIGVVPLDGTLFEAFDDGADLDLELGELCDIKPGAGGSTTTGNSSFTLDANTNGNCIVVEQVTAPDNDRTLQDARYIVKFTSTAALFY